jgi:hypothetical protein
MKRVSLLASALVLLLACGGSVDLAPYGGSGGTDTTSGSGAQGGSGNSSTGGGSVGGSGNSGTGGAGNAGTGGAGNAGTGGSVGGGGTGGAAVCAGYGDACTECVATACPSTWCGCRNEPECIALSACYQTCKADQTCQQSCRTKFSGGISALYLVSDCAGTSCPKECPGNQPLGDCAACVLDHCPGAYDDCLADAECVALYQCFETCATNDLVCQQGCYAQHGAGTAKLQALLQCDSGPCTAACQ